MKLFKSLLKNKVFQRIMVILSSAVLLLALGYSLYVNSTLKVIEKSTDTRLAYYENLATQVATDIISYLSIKDERSYLLSKESVKMDDNFLNSLYGKDYTPSKFIGASKVEVNTFDFSLSQDDKVSILLDITYEKGNDKFDLSMVVFTMNGLIYDIITGG